jgi:hypothetical protein
VTPETVEKLWQHRLECGSHDYTKTTVQRDAATGARYYVYRCMTCKAEFREPLDGIESVEVPKEKAA